MILNSERIDCLQMKIKILKAVLGLAVGAIFIPNFIEAEIPYRNPQYGLVELSEVQKQKAYLRDLLDWDWKRYRLFYDVIECESGFNQNAISRTKDFGLFQINELTWNKKAAELGLNYKNNWQDNLKMGLWIYENAGGFKNWVCYTNKKGYE